jgi:hypothetical protein
LFLAFTGSGVIPWILRQPPLAAAAAAIAFVAVLGLWLRFVMTHPSRR